MSIDINWTTVIASAVTAMIVGGAQFIANRYLARILDHIDKELVKGNRDERKEVDEKRIRR